MFPFYYFGPYGWLLLPGLLLGLYAQVKLWSAYSRYARVGLRSNVSGAQAAREILDSAGLRDIAIEEIGGQLTDHYDPTKRALFLSAENYQGNSVSAVGVAAHEAGHALQHKAGYAPLEFRMKLVPITQFASAASFGILFFGMILSGPFAHKLLLLAIAAFAIVAFFQLVTLPVEFDASRRAKIQLVNLGLVQPDESEGVSRVLNAAAWTYVAALVNAVLVLLRLILIARDDRN
jgi:Zn-dependent membrane protease YugP